MQEHDFHIIRTHGLTKTFGEHRAVNNVDLLVPQGTVYGFLGPNGSGKSTTMKLLLGLMKPTAGEVFINGRKLTKASRPELLGRVGSMIEAPPGYGHLTGWENLQIVQSMLGLEERQIAQALDIVRLTKNKDKLVKNYSLGMKQRLALGVALIGNPEMLILDEPINGLDANGVAWMRKKLTNFAQEGKSVLLSSHLMSEVELTATHVAILNHGKIQVYDSLENLQYQKNAVVFGIPDNSTSLLDSLNYHGISVSHVTDNTHKNKYIALNISTRELFQYAVESKTTLDFLAPQHDSLESIYFDYLNK